MAMPAKRTKDRRVQRTEQLLHQALGSLIREKPFDSIVVKEILERANIGRSTFYTHFRDKDDLLVGGIHDMLWSAQATALPPPTPRSERLVWFSLPVFEHLERHRHTSDVKIATIEWAHVHERLEQVLAELIADQLRTDLQRRRKMPSLIPPDLLAHYVASTFMVTMTWWVESRSPLPPKEINDLFRSWIMPALAAILD
jgi:AcrR family transcriptional regulator